MTMRWLWVSAVVPFTMACSSMVPEHEKVIGMAHDSPAAGEANIAMAAGKLQVCGERAQDRGLLTEAEFHGAEPTLVRKETDIQGNIGIYDERANPTGDAAWRVCFDDRIPLDVDMELGDVVAELDFDELWLRSLDLDLGSGRTEVEIGPSMTEGDVRIHGGSGPLELQFDDDVGVRLVVDRRAPNAGTLDFGDEFTYRDGAYYNHAYDRDPPTLVNVLLVMGTGEVQLEEE